MKIIKLPSLGTTWPKISFNSEMNYKRKKRHTKKIIKSKALNSSVSSWTYGGKIAREISLRKEFKKTKLQVGGKVS